MIYTLYHGIQRTRRDWVSMGLRYGAVGLAVLALSLALQVFWHNNTSQTYKATTVNSTKTSPLVNTDAPVSAPAEVPETPAASNDTLVVITPAYARAATAIPRSTPSPQGSTTIPTATEPALTTNETPAPTTDTSSPSETPPEDTGTPTDTDTPPTDLAPGTTVTLPPAL